MNKKSRYKAIIAFAVALAFILPTSAVFANVGTIGSTSNSENTIDINKNDIEEMNSDAFIDNYDNDIEEMYLDYELEREPRVKEHRVSVESIKVKLTNNALTSGTIYVDDDADPGWYNDTQVKTIQEGVDNASAGWTVYVYNGTYSECVYIDKQLDLIGESRENVIVDGGEGLGNVVSVTVNDVIIDTFTITNGVYGVYLEESSGSTIENCNVYGNSYGIYIGAWSVPADNNNIINCNVYDNENYGIYFYGASNSMLRDNAIYGSMYNFVVDGGYQPSVNKFYHDIDDTNTIDGKPIWYLVGQSDETIDETSYFGYLGLISCTNITVKDLYVNGMLIVDTIDSTISNVYSSNSEKGIYLFDSSDNQISNCNAESITIYYGSYNQISNSDFHESQEQGAIFIQLSSNNNITDCNVYEHEGYAGIFVDDSQYNNFINCTSYDNWDNGVFLYGGTADYNNFINCTSYNNGRIVGGTAYIGHGFWLYHDPDYNEFINCTTYGNIGHGFCVQDGTYNKFENCSSYNNYYDGIIFTTESDNNNIINCDSYSNNNGHGFLISVSSNNNIVNCRFYMNELGIRFDRSPGNNFIDCTFNNNEYGINLDCSPGNNFENTEINDNDYGISVTGESPSDFVQDIDPSNTVNRNPIYYLVGINDFEINETHNCGYLVLISCTNITAINADVNGILLVNTIDSTISNVDSHRSTYGVYLWQSSNNEIINSNFYDSAYGIYLTSSSNNNITNCDSHDNIDGVSFISSPNNNLKDTAINDNTYNLDVTGEFLSEFVQDIDTSNTINQKSIYYLVGINDFKINETHNCGYLGLISCTNIEANNLDVSGILILDTINSTISNVDSHRSTYGVYLWQSSNNEIINYDSYSNRYGICLVGSQGNSIINGEAHANPGSGEKPYGILLTNSPNNNIIDATVYDNFRGIVLENSPNNNLTNCNVYNNHFRGIQIAGSSNTNLFNCRFYNTYYDNLLSYDSSDCNIINCTFANSMRKGVSLESGSNIKFINCSFYNNAQDGIYIWYGCSDDILIYRNNFVNNMPNAQSQSLIMWDNGNKGNYWSDYREKYPDAMQINGIWDIPYEIPGGGQDNYPLIKPIIDAPELLSPADESAIEDQIPTFDWTDVEPIYPLNYTLHVWNSTGEVLSVTGILESEYTPTANMAYDTYYWKVKAMVGNYTTDWSEIWNFAIELAEFIEVTTLSQKWNMISMPFSYSVDKADIIVEYDGTDYSWADAVSENIVAKVLFGWDRINQGYLPDSGILDPGYGYWLWAYHDCLLKVSV